jgi:hypothetical protein
MGLGRCRLIFFVLIYVSFNAASVLLAHGQVVVQALTYAFFIGSLALLLLFFQTLAMILFLGTLQSQQLVATGIEITQDTPIQRKQRHRHFFHRFHLCFELAQELLPPDVAITGIPKRANRTARFFFRYEFQSDSQGIFNVGLFDVGPLHFGFPDDLFLIQPRSDPIDDLLIEGVDIELLLGVRSGHDRLLKVDGVSTKGPMSHGLSRGFGWLVRIKGWK